MPACVPIRLPSAPSLQHRGYISLLLHFGRSDTCLLADLDPFRTKPEVTLL